MKLAPKPMCAECDTPDAKIVTLFLRNCYCGRFCLAEGQMKIARWLIRIKAEEINDGTA